MHFHQTGFPNEGDHVIPPHPASGHDHHPVAGAAHELSELRPALPSRPRATAGENARHTRRDQIVDGRELLPHIIERSVEGDRRGLGHAHQCRQGFPINDAVRREDPEYEPIRTGCAVTGNRFAHGREFLAGHDVGPGPGPNHDVHGDINVRTNIFQQGDRRGESTHFEVATQLEPLRTSLRGSHCLGNGRHTGLDQRHGATQSALLAPSPTLSPTECFDHGPVLGVRAS